MLLKLNLEKDLKGLPANNWIRVDILNENLVLPFALVPNVGKITTILNDKLDLIWLNKTTPVESMRNEIQPKVQATS